MTSERKIRANQKNAKASTGPRTALGKAKAAKNARRHGLNIDVRADPARTGEARKFARDIAGKKPSLEVLDVAQRIAEATIDLVRIRKARHSLFRKTRFPFEKIRGRKYGPPQAKRFVIELLDLTRKVELITRYERRALSRRKFAIRELDALRQQGVS